MRTSLNPGYLPDQQWVDPHCWSIRVYYEDTDAGGVVFYANYLKFMERARTEWLRELGVSQQELSEEKRLVFVVTGLSIDYKAPARLDDLLSIESVVSRIRRASLTFSQRIVCQGQLLAISQIRVGCVDVDSMRPVVIPDEIFQRICSTSQR